MTNIDRVVAFIKSDASLSPVTKQVLINRISFPPTTAEIERARAIVMGKAPAAAPN